MENKIKIQFFLLLATALITGSCESQQKKYASPPGYNLNKPKRYPMQAVLHEISGIAFNKGKNDTLYAEQDEEGKVFHFKLGDSHIDATRFGKKGDYEDISICNNYVVMLRSDGILFTFPLAETNQPEAEQVKVFKGLLPDGEYEGLASVDSLGKIFVLCKHCGEEKTSKRGGGFIFQLSNTGNLTQAGDFEIRVREIESLAGTAKINFHPSALALNPQTREWYILSSTNKLLVVTDQAWKVKNIYMLDPAIFPQPEGIAFDRQRNLYISNERNQAPAGTVLVFSLQQP